MIYHITLCHSVRYISYHTFVLHRAGDALGHLHGGGRAEVAVVGALHVCMYVCMYISLSLSLYMYIYIYIEREREIDRRIDKIDKAHTYLPRSLASWRRWSPYRGSASDACRSPSRSTRPASPRRPPGGCRTSPRPRPGPAPVMRRVNMRLIRST